VVLYPSSPKNEIALRRMRRHNDMTQKNLVHTVTVSKSTIVWLHSGAKKRGKKGGQAEENAPFLDAKNEKGVRGARAAGFGGHRLDPENS
jgi:hypothetical protein